MFTITVTLALAVTAIGAGPVRGPDPTERLREVLVPFDDLNVLLASNPSRVLLSRGRYETLLAEARRVPDVGPPLVAAIVAASYEASLGNERARINGALIVDVLEVGLQTVALVLGQVGVRRARLDGVDAPLGQGQDGRLLLFVEGKGRHDLAIELVAPLATDSARQTLNIRVPTPASTRFHLTVDGDVEVEGGPAVMSRVFDPVTGTTRIEIALDRDRILRLVMTLNSRLTREQRLVVAR
ncbi:MAG: hypothetical protein O7C98_04860, partial [Planctomycetota bacterium]|nr:hypothetical protein [Planctomycetota bacterium]